MEEQFRRYARDVAKIFNVIFCWKASPTYEEIYTNFVKLLGRMPKEVKQLYMFSMASSTTRTRDNVKGGDALLEEINKGIGSSEQWLKCTRLLEKLETIRENVRSELGMTDPLERTKRAVPAKHVAFVTSKIKMSEFMTGRLNFENISISPLLIILRQTLWKGKY